MKKNKKSISCVEWDEDEGLLPWVIIIGLMVTFIGVYGLFGEYICEFLEKC